MSEESKIAWDLWKNSQKQKREVMCSKYRSLHFAEKFSNENKYFRKHMIDFFSRKNMPFTFFKKKKKEKTPMFSIYFLSASQVN